MINYQIYLVRPWTPCLGDLASVFITRLPEFCARRPGPMSPCMISQARWPKQGALGKVTEA